MPNKKVTKPLASRSGPFRVMEDDLIATVQESSERRSYECDHYISCLNLAAALDWDSFTCQGCKGEFDQALLWQARSAIRKDQLMQEVCELPPACFFERRAESVKDKTGQVTGKVEEEIAADEEWSAQVND